MPPTLSRTKRTVSLLVLVLIVLASATQTEVANYLGAQRGYSKPYFTFFLTHSFFTIIFPIHLLILAYIPRSLRQQQKRQRSSTRTLLRGLRHVTAIQLGIDPFDPKEIYKQTLKVVFKLTLLISFPSISWYIAVPLTGTTDLTTIYATATFWTYGFSLLLLRTPLSRLILLSILIAFAGVLMITYSGVEESQQHEHHRHHSHEDEVVGGGSEKVDNRVDGGDAKGTTSEPPHRILGNLIMLFGAIVLGFYEVVYKLALPEGQGGVVASSEEKDDAMVGVVHDVEPGYQAVSHGPDTLGTGISADQDQGPGRAPDHRRSESDQSMSSDLEDDDRAYPLASPLDSGTRLNPIAPLSSRRQTKLPLALHANMLTSLIGVLTLCFFWIPIPLLHWLGWERFELPWGNMGYLFVVCLTGAVYNAGFMILIGLLGPTTASVANLLTIGIVALADAFFLGHSIPFWTLIGAGLVGSGFAMLLWAGEEDGSSDG